MEEKYPYKIKKMSVTGSVYYSYLKSINACQEGLDYVATQSCQDASRKCCPTPEIGNVWSNSLPNMTGYFTPQERDYIQTKLAKIRQESGDQAAYEWVYNHFGEIYMNDIDSKTLVTEGLISHIDVCIPYSYPGDGSNIFDLSGNLTHGIILGNVNYSPGYISFLNLSGQDSCVDFGKKFWFAPDNSDLGQDFTLRVVCRFSSYNQDSQERVTLFSKSDNLSGYRLEIASDRLIWSSTDASSEKREILSNLGPNELGKWYDISVSVTSGRATLYLDGVSVSQSIEIGQSKPNNSPFEIGRFDDYSYGFDFMHFSSWSRGLTSEEILRNYRCMKGRFYL